MISREKHTLGPGFCNEEGVFIPYLAAVIPEAYADKPTPSQNRPKLETFLIYAVPPSGENPPLTFAEHLTRLVGKSSVRKFAKDVDVNHAVLTRLLNSDRIPGLSTVARIIEGSGLSDAQAYKIIIGSATVSMPIGIGRRVFSDDAPVLKGSVAEQLKGYRDARGLFQRVLAGRTGFSHSTISRLESEDRVPGLLAFANSTVVLGLNTKQVRGVLRAASMSKARQKPEITRE
jgi:predicted transcriptional regulator